MATRTSSDIINVAPGAPNYNPVKHLSIWRDWGTPAVGNARVETFVILYIRRHQEEEFD